MDIKEKIFGKTVDVKVETTDKYGRTVGNIYLGDQWINLEMVQDGFAWHYKQYSQSTELAKAEDEARENKKGLWADKDPMPPWEFRHGGMNTAKKDPKGNYVSSKNGQVYHVKDCKAVGKIKEANLIWFDDEKDAERSGKRPCKMCGG